MKGGDADKQGDRPRVGCITVFGKKTEGTAAVEVRKKSCSWCFGVLQLPKKITMK
jgi:hypothetical protein